MIKNVVGLSLFFGSLLVANAAIACDYGVYDRRPSQETREIRANGYSFDIPANYRTELSGAGTIAVMDPDTYQFLACVEREGWGTDDFSYITIGFSDVVVKSDTWPYDIPNLQYMENPRYKYGDESDGRHWSIIQSFSDFHNADTADYYENLPGGRGSVHVDAAEYDFEAFDMVINSIRFN